VGWTRNLEILAKGVKLDFLINCIGEGIIVGYRVKCPVQHVYLNLIRTQKPLNSKLIVWLLHYIPNRTRLKTMLPSV